MVGVFCFCWTPYATISMAAILGHGEVNFPTQRFVEDPLTRAGFLEETLTDFLQSIPLSTTVLPLQFAKSAIVWNPVIYLVMNPMVNIYYIININIKNIFGVRLLIAINVILFFVVIVEWPSSSFVVTSMVVIFITVIIAIMIVVTINMCSVPWSFPRNPTGPACGASSCFSAESDGLGGYGGWCRLELEILSALHRKCCF